MSCKDCEHFLRETDDSGNITAESCEISLTPMLCIKRLLNVKQAAVLLDISEYTLREYVAEKRIKHIRIGDLIKFNMEILDEFINARVVARSPIHNLKNHNKGGYNNGKN